MNSFLATLRQLGPARLAIMGLVLVGLLGFFGFMSMRISSPGMKLLYDNISVQDAGSIAAKLDEAKIKYDVSPDGTRIMVPGNEVGQARMLLAKDGLPNGGTMGYEIFDQQSGFGTTNFVQNINQVRALEGELARTISAVSSVRSARVHLVLPERELFSRDSRPASAAVFLTLRGSSQLDQGQVAAIQSLVAAAVPDLKAKSVSVIDSNGNLLARGGPDDGTAMPVEAEEMRHAYETRLTTQVQDLVGQVVGYGHVHATVAADLNMDRVTTNSETYDPNGQVARSTQTTSDKNSEHTSTQNSNDVSVANNLPAIAGNDSGAGGGTGSDANKTEETTNYEISKTTKASVSEIGDVKKLSIAVLVDGTYVTGKDGKKVYSPRSQAELDKISALVKSAVGFDDKRGDTIDVANLQFADEDAGAADAAASTQIMGFERSELLSAGEVIVLALMGVLVLLLVIRPMVGSVLAVEDRAAGGGSGGRGASGGGDTALLPARAANPALPAPGFSSASSDEEDALIDMSRVEGKVKASAVKKVEDIVNNYPGETVSVIRSWMSQET